MASLTSQQRDIIRASAYGLVGTAAQAFEAGVIARLDKKLAAGTIKTVTANNVKAAISAELAMGSSGIPPVRIIGTKFGPNGGGEADGLLGDASHTAGTSRFRIDMPAYDVELQWVEYWNGYISMTQAAEQQGPNAINVKSAWEAADGTNTPLYGNGLRRQISLNPGERARFRPQQKLIVPGGTLPFARQFVSVGTAGQQWPCNRIAHNSNLGESDNVFGTGAGTDQTDATGTFGSATFTYAFGPCGIYGIPADRQRRKAVALFQDSIGTNSGDDAVGNRGDANGYMGWLERALTNQYAFINAARATSRMQWVAAGFDNQISMIAPYVTSAIIQLGVNDWSTGRTLAQMQADLATMVTALQAYGVAVFVCTTSPKVTATTNAYVDGGSAINSGPSGIGNSYNTWVRTLPLGIRGCIDVANILEDPGRPGYFLPYSPALTTDGTHYSTTAMNLAAPALDLNALV